MWGGQKRVELRRVAPKLALPATALIYASSPRMRLELVATATEVVRTDLETLWTRFGHAAGVSRDEFDDYFSGCMSGVAIILTDLVPIRRSVTLRRLRRLAGGFRPPQSFRYVYAAELSRLDALIARTTVVGRDAVAAGV